MGGLGTLTVYDTVVMIKAEEETTQSLESSTVRIKSHHQIWANDRIELQSIPEVDQFELRAECETVE